MGGGCGVWSEGGVCGGMVGCVEKVYGVCGEVGGGCGMWEKVGGGGSDCLW